MLALVESPASSNVEYVIGGKQLTAADREAAAQLLADDAMRLRCGKSPTLTRWRANRDGGPAADRSGSRSGPGICRDRVRAARSSRKR
jgi:hypothetical protein